MIACHYPPLEQRPANWGNRWWPINGAQQAARNCWADLLLYGGASGGGKTQYLVAEAASEHKNPALSGLIIRRQRTDMPELKAIMQALYKPMGARHDRLEHAWRFPSGASVRYGYLKTDAHLEHYQGNPYSFLGIDESGQHPESRVRIMLGWLAASESAGLRVRGRFTCNPGGEGYGWEMQVFLRNRCPIHDPAPPDDSRPYETSVVPGKVYRGGRWTTGEPVGMTTCFIPAFIQDNPDYFKIKIKALRTQSAAVRKQLLDGCWCNAEGIYFDFLQPSMSVPLQTIGEEWWWNHFISIDYGYGSSSAAVGMYAVSPLGRVYKVRERDEPKMGSEDFAMAICEKGFEKTDRSPAQGNWLKKLRDRDPERPRINFCVIDSANDQHHGTGKSNFEIISAIFAKYGIPCIKAGKEAKDSQASAQNLYSGLSNFNLVLTNACPRTYKCLSSRVVDIDGPRAIKKLRGDPMDDVLDETRYGYNTWIDQSVMPARVALEKEIQDMVDRGLDETSIAHYKWRREREIDDQERLMAKGIQLGASNVLLGG